MDAAALVPGGAAIVAVPALEYVALWNTRTSTLVAKLQPPNARRSRTNEVTSVQLYKDPVTPRAWILVAGYASGYVAMWRGRGEDQWECTLHGLSHRPDSIVLCSDMNADASRIATGGGDTDITLWDTAADEPLYRLVGHRGGVVGVAFVSTKKTILISGAADGLVKVWNLRVQQCIQTIVASDTQVTALRMDAGGLRLFVGVRDDVLKVYNTEALGAAGGDDRDDAVVEHGALKRKVNKPTTAVAFSHDKNHLAVVTNRTVEVFRVLNAQEVKKKVQRRRKRRQEAAAKANKLAAPPAKSNRAEGDAVAADGVSHAGDNDNDVDHEGDDGAFQRTAAEEFVSLRLFHFDEKIRGLTFLPVKQNAAATPLIRFAVATAHNTIDVHEAAITRGADGDEDDDSGPVGLGDLKMRLTIDNISHRTDIRSMSFTSLDMSLLSMSSDCIRVWGTRHRAALGTEADDSGFADEMREGYGAALPDPTQRLTCASSLEPAPGTELVGAVVVLPGDQHAVVGTQDGHLLVVSIQRSEIVDDIVAHPSAPITSLCSMNEGAVILSCAKDRKILRWDVTVVKKGDQKHVSLQLRDEVELAETPLYVRATPNNKLIGVALQDHNVQLLHGDTFKPFLSLFGHKLPVTSIAYSADSTLCATVSMDKSLRFWGLDFGDCHRFIHAHDDYVTDVKFIGVTHYVVTCSLDGTVKYWDGDTWTLIQVLRLHQRGVWALAVNGDGTFIATAGVDKCVRTILRTHESIFPEEEEQRDAQEAMDDLALRDAAKAKLENIAAGEVGVGGHRSLATAEAGEALMEALDLVSVELQRLADGGIGDPHPLLRNKSPFEFLWSRISDIKPSEVRHALSSLTSVHIAALLQLLLRCCNEGAVTSYETATRVLLAAVKPAPGANVAVPIAIGDDVNVLALLADLRVAIGKGLQADRDRFGRNTAGLVFVQESIARHDKVVFYDKSKIQGAKRKFQKNQLTSTTATTS